MTLRHHTYCPLNQPMIKRWVMLGYVPRRLESVICYFYGCGGRHAFGLCFSLVLLCGFLLLGYPPLIRAEQPSEYRLKVAFLYNFIAFTEWPDLPGQVLNVCVHGDDPFGENLQYLWQKKSNDYELTIRHTRNSEDLLDCHVVFITRSVIDKLDEIINLLHAKPILTIADTPGVSQQGVVLNMAIKEGKVIFEANLASAKKNGLRLSAQLLRFATEVYQ